MGRGGRRGRQVQAGPQGRLAVSLSGGASRLGASLIGFSFKHHDSLMFTKYQQEMVWPTLPVTSEIIVFISRWILGTPSFHPLKRHQMVGLALIVEVRLHVLLFKGCKFFWQVVLITVLLVTEELLNLLLNSTSVVHTRLLPAPKRCRLSRDLMEAKEEANWGEYSR